MVLMSSFHEVNKPTRIELERQYLTGVRDLGIPDWPRNNCYEVTNGEHSGYLYSRQLPSSPSILHCLMQSHDSY